MKRTAITTLSLTFAAGLVITLAGIGAAQTSETPALSKDAANLNSEIAMLNAEVSLPQGEVIISKQLTDTFRVGSSKLDSLEARNLEYGDIAAVLAFAEKMPGGLTDANIDRVISTRSGAAGWDQAASKLNIPIDKVASRLSSIEEKTHKNIKQAYADSLVAGAAGGGVTGVPDEEVPGETEGGIYDEQPGEPGTQPPGEIEGGATGGAEDGVYGGGGTETKPPMDEGETGQVPGGSGY